MRHNSVSGASSARGAAITLGFWSAISAAVLAVLFAVLAIGFSPPEWTGMEAYAEAFHFLQMANMIPVMLMTIAVVAVMACLHYVAPDAKKVFSLIGLVLSGAYTAIICTNYNLQLFVVRLNILSGDLSGLSLLAMPNLHSVFFALETVGYAFLSIAALCIVPVISGGRLGNGIRICLLVSSGMGLFGAVVAPFDQPVLIFAGLGIWSLVFPVAMILIGVYFRRLSKVVNA